MREYKIYICSAVFVCLTAVKLCFPDSSAQLRERVCKLISQEANYAEMIQAMGSSLGRGQLREELVQALGRLLAEEEELVSAVNTAEVDTKPAAESVDDE